MEALNQEDLELEFHTIEGSGFLVWPLKDKIAFISDNELSIFDSDLEKLDYRIKMKNYQQPFIKALGISEQIPSIIIEKPNRKYKGLAILEKKRPNKDQRYWLDRLMMNGWYTRTCNTEEEINDIVQKYINNEIE